MIGKRASWANGERVVRGQWHYNWAARRFIIQLDQRDRTTGRGKCFTVAGDVPEWGKWKIVCERGGK